MENQTPYTASEQASEIFEQEVEVFAEPPKIGLATVFFRTLAGFFGGLIGSAVIFAIIMITQATLQEIFAREVNPVLVFVVLAIAFLSPIFSSIASVSLIGYVQQFKYQRLISTLVQVFVLNLIVFLILLPVYVLICLNDSGNDFKMVAYLAGLHAFISILGSTLVMEIMSDYRYAILGVHSATVATLLAILIAFFLHTSFDTAIVPLLALLPLGWGMVGLMVGVAEMIYRWIYETYGKDYLSLNTHYGAEYDKANISDEDYGEKADSKEQIFNEE